MLGIITYIYNICQAIILVRGDKFENNATEDRMLAYFKPHLCLSLPFTKEGTNEKKGMVVIMKDKLVIEKKSLKGEDGYKTFSIRIKEETVRRLDDLAIETNRSRNELINILLDFAIEHSEVK